MQNTIAETMHIDMQILQREYQQLLAQLQVHEKLYHGMLQLHQILSKITISKQATILVCQHMVFSALYFIC